MTIQFDPPTRSQQALAALQFEFMQNAEPGAWHPLPGGTEEGCLLWPGLHIKRPLSL